MIVVLAELDHLFLKYEKKLYIILVKKIYASEEYGQKKLN